MQRGGRITRKPGGPTSLSNVQEKQANSEEEDNDASGVVESTEGEGKEPSMSDLVALLQAHMGQTEAQAAKQSEITTRQEQRFETMQQQFQLLQLEVQARTSPVSDSLSADPDPPEVEVLPSTSNHPLVQAEPFTMAAHPDLAVWIRERDPGSVMEAAGLAVV
ncbi:hypothetical protein NQZ68_016844 [Dissostichus eleginoides]|nr:hypothetical protein NQZ68_016844 [Dissostichus eleginoides]